MFPNDLWSCDSSLDHQSVFVSLVFCKYGNTLLIFAQSAVSLKGSFYYAHIML